MTTRGIFPNSYLSGQTATALVALAGDVLWDTSAAAGLAAPSGSHSSQPLQWVQDAFIQSIIWVFFHSHVIGKNHSVCREIGRMFRMPPNKLTANQNCMFCVKSETSIIQICPDLTGNIGHTRTIRLWIQ